MTDIVPGFGALDADGELEPIKLSNIKRELNMVETVVKAKDLTDRELTIIGARYIPSELAEGEYYYFCAVHVDGSEEVYGVALGGGVVVDTINRYVASGNRAPLVTTLRFHVGAGKHEGYYTLD